MTHAPFRGIAQSDYRLLHPEKGRGKVILALRTDKPEAELYLYDVRDTSADTAISREEQPEQKSHFLPGAMRNPEGVSYRPKATIKWQAHLKLTETIHLRIKEILNELSISLKDIEGIVCFKGPGSFTGLRIGLSVANALAYAQNVPVIASGGKGWCPAGIKKLLAGQDDRVATPKYDRPVSVTRPKK